jgi:two-component sensor histidine kinase
LLGQLIPILQQIAGPREIRCRVDDALLHGQHGVSLALIVNELVVNALQHGEGTVEIIFEVRGETASLEISDGGAGLPTGFDPKVQTSTGVYLVGNLVSMDLKGVIAFENRPEGRVARVRITFLIAAPGE